MSSFQSPNLVVSGNKLHDNAWAGFSCAWECGNAKLVSVPGLSFIGNESWNGHVGVWCDIGCTNGSIDTNNIHDNDQLGIVVEISSGMTVTNNTITHNAFAAGYDNQAGIWSSASGGTEISGNTLVNNGLECCPSGAGIFASDEARGDALSDHGTNISVHDNHITEPNGSRALAWWQIGVTTICSSGTNHGLNNWYHYPTPEDGELRFGWCHDMPDLASFQQTLGGQGGLLRHSRHADADRHSDADMDPEPEQHRYEPADEHAHRYGHQRAHADCDPGWGLHGDPDPHPVPAPDAAADPCAAPILRPLAIAERTGSPGG
jgi:parallel beta-helix repeat protein